MLSLTRVAGAVTQVAARPVAAVVGVEALLAQLGQVATRAHGLLDLAEPVAGRISAVAHDAERTVHRVVDLVARAEQTADRVDALAQQAAVTASRAEEATADAAGTVAAVQPLVQAVGALDPQALVALVESIPVVLDRLAAQVDHLDRTVADVGALLSGIPGAARLAKRGGDRLTAR